MGRCSQRHGTGREGGEGGIREGSTGGECLGISPNGKGELQFIPCHRVWHKVASPMKVGRYGR